MRESASPTGVSTGRFGEETGDLRQTDSDDDGLAVLELVRSGGDHDFGGADVAHL
jgi:hypothetical protein